MCVDFLCPKYDNFACLHIRQDQNELHLLSEARTHHCLVRILVQSDNWAIFLRTWARTGRYSQWRSLSDHVERIFAIIGFFYKSISGPLSEAKTHWMVNWLQLLKQLNFVWSYTKVFMQTSSQWCLRNVHLLRTTVNWCWWRFIHTLSATATIFSAVRSIFDFPRFDLLMKMPVFFTFFTR